MSENGSDTADRSSGKNRRILIAAVCIGAAAAAIFLAAFLLLNGNNHPVLEGAGLYRAYASDFMGVKTRRSSETVLELNLYSGGSCTVSLGDRRKRGTWSRDKEKMYVVCGKKKYAGYFRNDDLYIKEIGGEEVEIILHQEEEEPFLCPKGLSGKWLLYSVTDGDTVYDGKAFPGYSGELDIKMDGSGSAVLLDGVKRQIRFRKHTLEINGLLLEYSFTGTQLLLQYSDAVVLSFRKSA